MKRSSTDSVARMISGPQRETMLTYILNSLKWEALQNALLEGQIKASTALEQLYP